MLLNVVYSSFPFSMYERKVYHFSGKVMEKIRSFMRIRKFYFLLSFPRERSICFRGVLSCSILFYPVHFGLYYNSLHTKLSIKTHYYNLWFRST